MVYIFSCWCKAYTLYKEKYHRAKNIVVRSKQRIEELSKQVEDLRDICTDLERQVIDRDSSLSRLLHDKVVLEQRFSECHDQLNSVDTRIEYLSKGKSKHELARDNETLSRSLQ